MFHEHNILVSNVNTLFEFVLYLFKNFFNILRKYFLFVLLAFAFAGFVVVNKGIVVGNVLVQNINDIL